MKYWPAVLHLRQIICEWFHVPHWFGYEFTPEDVHPLFHMHCTKCGRWWSSEDNEQPDQATAARNREKHERECDLEANLAG